jgi:hypothetical protein
MIRGSKIAPYVDGVWGCEFIETPLQPGFLTQGEFGNTEETEIAFSLGILVIFFRVYYDDN